MQTVHLLSCQPEGNRIRVLSELEGYVCTQPAVPAPLFCLSTCRMPSVCLLMISLPMMALQVEWKLTRGKWRPRLLDFAKELSDDAVKDASTDAFKSAAAGNSTAAFAALTKLKVLF